MAETEIQAKPVLKRLLRSWTARVLFALLVLIIVLFSMRRPIMGSFGSWLVVSEEPVPSDVIIILGGELGHRVLKAIELYRNGYATRIAITGAGTDFPELESPPYERWIRLFEKHGIPRAAIDFVVPSHSTYDDAMLCRTYFEENRYTSALLVTDPYHTRRANWVFERMKGKRDWELRIIACDRDEVTPNRWWRDERQFLCVMTEYMKLVYYVFSYGFSKSLSDRPARAHRQAHDATGKG